MTARPRPFRLTRPEPPEAEIHRGIRRLLDVALPRGAVHFAVDPSLGDSPVAGARLKARGGRRGIPDHLIAWSGRTLWLEIKAPDGRLSEHQRQLHGELHRAGHQVAVVRSASDVLAALAAAGIPTRAAISA